MTPEMTSVGLGTLGSGAAAEMFDDELQKVLANIEDPNTDPEAVRVIVFKVEIRPTPDRATSAVSIACTSKLASVRKAATTLFLGRQAGRRVALEHDPHQLQLDFDAASRPVPIDGGKSV